MNRIQRIIEELLKDPQTTDQQRITKQRRKERLNKEVEINLNPKTKKK